MVNGYMITISRVDNGQVEAECNRFVRDNDLKKVNKEVGISMVQHEVRSCLNELDFNHLFLGESK